MLRLPSNQRSRDDFYSRDPAFIQQPRREDFTDDATFDAASKDYGTKLRVAVETGNWTEMRLAGGSEPTKFVMAPLGSDAFRALVDQVMCDKVGSSVARQIAFRASCQTIVNIGGEHAVKRNTRHVDYGVLVDAETVDLLDGIDPGIVSELGQRVLDRARSPSPK